MLRLQSLALTLPWLALARPANQTPSENEQNCHHSLIQLNRVLGTGSSKSCAPLTDRGTHAEVQLEVGTPPLGKSQKVLNALVDTGSNSVLVRTCNCILMGKCHSDGSCFEGKSTTLSMQSFPRRKTLKPYRRYAKVELAVGNGEIDALVASDLVAVGGIQANMSRGLLLMINREELEFGDRLEGVVGLGIPGGERLYLRQKALREERDPDHEYSPPEFLDRARVSRFSLCFIRGGGSLRFSPEPVPGALSSFGKLRWGLGLNGIAVGRADAPARVCSPMDLEFGQATPCGAMPDSATTLITGPSAQVRTLFENVCDEWPRCKALSSSRDKIDVFMDILRNCSSWMDKSNGLSEMPDLHFNLTGAGDGERQVLSLGGNDYVAETREALYKVTTKYLFGIFPYEERDPDGAHKVCVPAIGALESHSVTNGGIWHLGKPFFHRFEVHFDRKRGNETPSVAFTNGPCSPCDGSVALLDQGSPQARRTRPLELHGEPRVPRSVLAHGGIF